MSELTRRDVLDAFGVTEEDLLELDPDGSYERAGEAARAERDAFWQRVQEAASHDRMLSFLDGLRDEAAVRRWAVREVDRIASSLLPLRPAGAPLPFLPHTALDPLGRPVVVRRDIPDTVLRFV